jgi:hypothetical protein
MSKLSTKIESARIAQKEFQRTHSEEYRKAIWTVMIAYGGVFVPNEGNWRHQEMNYYGGRVEINREATRSALDLITEDNIDWANLNDPAEKMGYEFDGTENDSVKVPYLKGELVFKTGDPVIWLTGVNNGYDDDRSFGNLVQILQLDISFDDALEHLNERLGVTKTTYTNETSFSYSAFIPKL